MSSESIRNTEKKIKDISASIDIIKTYGGDTIDEKMQLSYLKLFLPIAKKGSAARDGHKHQKPLKINPGDTEALKNNKHKQMRKRADTLQGINREIRTLYDEIESNEQPQMKSIAKMFMDEMKLNDDRAWKYYGFTGVHSASGRKSKKKRVKRVGKKSRKKSHKKSRKKSRKNTKKRNRVQRGG